MATLIQIALWACTECGKEYQEEESALACEKQHVDSAIDRRWSKLFRQYHPRDSRWVFHCVDCGITLLEYEYLPDPRGPAAVGRRTFRSGQIASVKLLGGLRCCKCHDALRLKILEAMENYVQIQP